MNRPWMPLYIADYLADTAHLSAAQSGAYLHLIMHYWQTGGLPQDDQALARIARMTAPEWKKSRAIVEAFFDVGWTHGRIDKELGEAARVSEAGRTAGRASGLARRAKAERERQRSINEMSNGRERSFNDLSTKPEPLPSPSLAAAGDARASLTDHLPAAERIWQGIAIDPDDPNWFGQQGRVAQWLADGWDLDLDILPTIARVMAKPNGKIRSLKYFEPAIADAYASRTAPLPVGTPQPNGGKSNGPRGDVIAAADDQIARIRAFSELPPSRTRAPGLCRDAGADAVRLLPDGRSE